MSGSKTSSAGDSAGSPIKKGKTRKTTGGRPRLELNLHQVFKLASLGLTNPEIAAIMNCSPDTLERHHREILARGREMASASVRRKQFQLAQRGNTTMLVWLGKNLCGQKDRIEATGKNDSPLFNPVDTEAIIEHIIKASERAGKDQG